MSTYRQLLAKKAELELQIEETRRAEIREVIVDIKRRMREYNLSVADLDERSDRRKAKPLRRLAKYRDPVSGATWSGRGRRPNWFNEKDSDSLVIR
ncbi:H-NS histone family protein [Paraburkholderia sp. BCC1885]|uniref:H-NS histone family protein n=1 Tax=Paraburkholderia sp. BCC1885 TaxID=2562669 RepID=UPI00118210EE|nr:H-NS histone family protein [Paraburkholderia sp. BCC1885]